MNHLLKKHHYATLLSAFVTYAQVQPLLENHCLECHHFKGPEPNMAHFPFQSSKEIDLTTIVERMIRMTKSHNMPPGARSKLSHSEIQILEDWLAQGLNP